MQHIIIRIMTGDYDTWLKGHYEYQELRLTYGITDGPIYRDIDNPNAVMIHLMAESMPKVIEWVSSQTFRDATAKAKVTGREIYLAEKLPQGG